MQELAVGCDAANAAAIETILTQIPHELPLVRGQQFPLLAALSRHDGETANGHRVATQLANDLVVVSALIHDDADERRTAEYLLRHRAEVASGRRSAASLLFSARWAAEMDCRRLHTTEIPSGDIELADAPDEVAGRVADRSVAETVLAYLDEVADNVVLPTQLRDHVMTATTIALEVSERHRLNNGQGPSVVAMRSDARPAGRLVTHLRAEFGRTPVADSLSRLLVGPDRSPIETSLLWWAAQGLASANLLPTQLRQRWSRVIADLVSKTAAGDLANPLSTDVRYLPVRDVSARSASASRPESQRVAGQSRGIDRGPAR